MVDQARLQAKIKKKLMIIASHIDKDRLGEDSYKWFDEKRKKHLKNLINDFEELQALAMASQSSVGGQLEQSLFTKLDEFFKELLQYWESGERSRLSFNNIGDYIEKLGKQLDEYMIYNPIRIQPAIRLNRPRDANHHIEGALPIDAHPYWVDGIIHFDSIIKPTDKYNDHKKKNKDDKKEEDFFKKNMKDSYELSPEAKVNLILTGLIEGLKKADFYLANPTALTDKRKQTLIEMGVPEEFFVKEPELGALYIQRLEEVQKMVNILKTAYMYVMPSLYTFVDDSKSKTKPMKFDEGNAIKFFTEALPASKSLVNNETFPIIRKIVENAGTASYTIFKDILPAHPEFTTKTRQKELLRMMQITGHVSRHILGETLPSLKHMITDSNWDEVLKRMENFKISMGSFIFSDMFTVYIPRFSSIINEKNFDHVMTGISDLMHESMNAKPEFTKKTRIEICFQVMRYFSFKEPEKWDGLVKAMKSLFKLHHRRIDEILAKILELVESKAVQNYDDLILVANYLQEFPLLSTSFFIKYKQQPENSRKLFIKTFKDRYKAVVWSENVDYKEVEMKELIVYAINSASLTQKIYDEVINKYLEKAQALPKPAFERFTVRIRDLEWVKGKTDTGFAARWAQFFASVEADKEPVAGKLDHLITMFKLDKDVDFMKYVSLESAPTEKFIVALLYYLVTRASGKQKTIIWNLLAWTTWQRLDNAKRRKILSLSAGQNARELRETLMSITEFFNDTMKDDIMLAKKHFAKDYEKVLMEHRLQSQLDKFGKEINKIKGKAAGGLFGQREMLHLVPSREPLDLFYGYYGENCCSSHPQELFNTKFTPVRIITEKDEIEGCVHYLETSAQGRKILVLVGIEPKESLMADMDPKLFLHNILSEIFSQAKKHGFDAVCISENSAMQSNRSTLRSLIVEYMAEKPTLNIDNINFPNGSAYGASKPFVVWQRPGVALQVEPYQKPEYRHDFGDLHLGAPILYDHFNDINNPHENEPRRPNPFFDIFRRGDR